MSHAPDFDFAAEAARELPRKFCEGRWRQVVVACVGVAILVLGYSVEEHFRLEARNGPGKAGAGPTRSVAFVRPAWGATSPPASSDIRLVAGTSQRTAFGSAAHAIRPSVLGIRATLGPGNAATPGLERSGSAVIVDPRGLAVTCHHVVAGAQQIAARRYHQPDRWLPVRVLAARDDLALLQVTDTQAFPAARFGDSSRVRVGDWVLAVGHPFGLGLTVTAGVVGRRNATLELPGGATYPDLLQTDAPINEGSSGGPLVNSAGEVVGLNTAIYAPTGVFAGAGFAIPGNRVQQFVAEVTGAGAMPSAQAAPSWGVGMVDLTPALSSRLAYASGEGVVINSVAPGSAAEAARFAPGDVVVSIAGQPVPNLQAVERIRTQLASAGSIPVQVWRQGNSLTLVLRPGSTTG